MGQSFTYDGFGNLTNVNVISGSAPIYSANPDPATNRLGCSDANGNSNVAGICGIYGNIYDVENRLVSSSASSGAGASYTYAPGNKRVWRGAGTYNADTGQWSTDEVTFWAPNGQKLGTYQVTAVLGCQFASPQCGNAAMAPEFYASQTGTYYYFGGRMVKNASAWVYGDRLGSIGKYYPYGQERPSATQNGTEKFTGYLRDSETGLDYADQRYYQPGMGRFLTADPYMANNGGPGDPASPSSWNRYTYVAGDPINSNDREGLYLNGNPGSGPFMGGEGPDPTDPGVGGPGGFGGGIGGLIRVCGYGSLSTPRFAPGKSGLSAGCTERVGGSGSVTPGSSTPLPPICNNATAVAFAKNYLTDLQQIADDLQIPVAWVLAVSAEESAWGTSSVARNANNYFGIVAGGIGSTGMYATRSNVYATFGGDGFLNSGRAFEAIAKSDGVMGMTDASQFFDAIHKQFGIKDLRDPTNDKYTPDMLRVLRTASQVLTCP